MTGISAAKLSQYMDIFSKISRPEKKKKLVKWMLLFFIFVISNLRKAGWICKGHLRQRKMPYRQPDLSRSVCRSSPSIFPIISGRLLGQWQSKRVHYMKLSLCHADSLFETGNISTCIWWRTCWKWQHTIQLSLLYLKSIGEERRSAHKTNLEGIMLQVKKANYT